MAKCTDCLHYNACLKFYKLVVGGEPTTIGNTAERVCENFKDRTKYVEVVRCKDCTNAVRHETFPWSRRCKIEDCRFSHKASHFCSYGERREGE